MQFSSQLVDHATKHWSALLYDIEIQEAQLLSLTNRATHFCKCKQASPMYVTTPNSVFLRSNHIRIRRRDPAQFGSARATPPWDGGRGWPPKNKHFSHMRYHAQFGCSLKCRHRYRRTPNIGERWGFAPWDGADVADPLKQPPPHMYYHVKFGNKPAWCSG